MRRRARGFTVAEVLTVLVIVGILLGAIAFAMPIFMRAPLEAQSQVDNVQSAALALYRVQRDVRQSDIVGVFDCSLPPAPTCSTPAPPPPGVTPPPTPALVVVTADNPAGLFQDSTGTGYPKWQGFYVYWLTPNADGTSYALHRIFYNDGTQILVNGNGQPTNLTLARAALVLTGAMLAPGVETVAQDVASIHVTMDQANGIVHLQVDGGDTSGNKSSLSLTSNSYVRN